MNSSVIQLKQYIKTTNNLFKIAWLIKNRRKINTLSKKILGRNNTINIPIPAIAENCSITIKGNNNSIDIGNFVELSNTKIYINGSNNRIHIADHVIFGTGGSLWIEDNYCLIDIGQRSTFEDANLAVTEDGSRIIIGEDCMFAYDVDVRTGDSHSIIDKLTKTRINKASDVTIGNHVWVAAHCSILKGVTIGDNSVVAGRSVVTKPFSQTGIIIGGAPAKIIKENITWDRVRL